MRPRTRTSLAAALMLFPLICSTEAAVYRVGPAEKYAKISELAAKLAPGDVVEVTGDIVDNFTLNTGSTPDNPLTVRGLTRIENGRIVRPEVSSAIPNATAVAECRGGANVIEGLAFGGFRGKEMGKGAVLHACSNLVLRNCHFHHNYRAVFADESVAGAILIEFCEFEANGYPTSPPVSLYSRMPGAEAVTQFCYFHDGTGHNSLCSCFARNVIRYNWFESPNKFAVQITTVGLSEEGSGDRRGVDLLPTHSDIVGNVFVHGWGYASDGALQMGGSGPESPGTEGDFNIAHNLIITRRGGSMLQIPFTVNGNVDRVRIYNNVIVECRAGGCQVYEREETWEGALSQSFKRRRGSGDPVIEGASNWISATASAVPPGLDNTVLGTNPGFYDLVNYDFRPVSTSPLARAGFWPLPEGRIAGLVAEFEPQRGIPADLKPRLRRQSIPPSIGPFEATDQEPGFADDSADLVFGARENAGMMQWQLGYAAARRKALEYLAEGKAGQALSCAKMQFILSAPDKDILESAISSVKQMLVAVDGNDERAREFDEYARHGAGGRDGLPGTPDDLKDPIGTVELGIFRRPASFYEELDARIEANEKMGAEGDFYTRWSLQSWHETQKAFARIEGGEFEAAVGILVPVLVESVKWAAADTSIAGSAKLRRNQNLLERISECLTAVARYRSDSLAGTSEFVENYVAYARCGAAGQDGTVGTEDDIDLRAPTRRGPLMAMQSRPDSRLDSLKDAHRGLASLRTLEARLAALANAKAKAVCQMELMLHEATSRQRTGFAGRCPSATELVRECEELGLEGELDLNGLVAAESEAGLAIYRDALLAADSCVIDAFQKLMDFRVDDDMRANARAYLSAFVIGAHSESTYQSALSALSARACGGSLPVFLVEDAALRLDAPFRAGEVVDALEACGGRWTQGEKGRLLRMIEDSQYGWIRSVQDRVKDMSASDAVRDYERTIACCDEFARRFADSRYRPDVEFQKGYCKYQMHDYEGAMRQLSELRSRFPGSRVVAASLFVEGLAALDSGKTLEGIRTLACVAEKYPDGEFAARALYACGHAYSTVQDYGKAGECFRRIVDFYSADPLSAKARDVLKRIEAGKGAR